MEWFESYKNYIRSGVKLAVTNYFQLNRRNNEWEGCSIKVSASKIWNDSTHTKMAFFLLLLPFCYWQCNITLTKQLMRVMQDEGEYIKNMEWVESYGNCIQSGKKITYFSVPGNAILYQQNNNTYYLQFTNSNNNNKLYKHAL